MGGSDSSKARVFVEWGKRNGWKGCFEDFGLAYWYNNLLDVLGLVL